MEITIVSVVEDNTNASQRADRETILVNTKGNQNELMSYFVFFDGSLK